MITQLHITQYAARQLFTFQEKIAITTLANQNPAYRALLDDLNSIQSNGTDVCLPDWIQGIEIFIAAGAVDASRRSALTDPKLVLDFVRTHYPKDLIFLERR
jgi:hypothetical protein